MTLFDTSAIIDLTRQEKWILNVLNTLRNQELAISVITLAEIKIGMHISKNKQESVVSALQNLIDNSVLNVINVDTKIANQVAILQNRLKSKGLTLAPFDSLIAATALERKATLVTSDSDFQRVKTLKLLTPPGSRQ